MLQQYLPLAVLKLYLLPSLSNLHTCKLQQYLPLAVLKPIGEDSYCATFPNRLQQYLPLAVLKRFLRWARLAHQSVATVLTACGIETGDDEAHRMDEDFVSCNSTYRLRYWNVLNFHFIFLLSKIVATVLTACGIETSSQLKEISLFSFSCNSTYRLRYWNSSGGWHQCNLITFVATVLTACGIETFKRKGANVSSFKLQQYLPLAVLKHR